MHWRQATGPAANRGVQPPSPRSEPIHGSNVIFLADHQRTTSPDDRPNSERLTAAPFFTPAPFDHREFGSWFFAALFFGFPSLIVAALVVGYLAFVA